MANKAACHIGVILTRLAGRELGLLGATGLGRQTSPCDGFASAPRLSPWGALLFRSSSFDLQHHFTTRR